MVIEMEDEKKLIKVSRDTWKELMHLKIERDAQSLDEVIQSLLEQAGVMESPQEVATDA